LIEFKRIGLLGLTLSGLGLASFSGGCSSSPESAVSGQTEEQKAREKKELEELSKANDESSKNAASNRTGR